MNSHNPAVHALVLVKERRHAKSRLGGVLLPCERMTLQDAMLDDVMSALAGSRELSGVAICSPDRFHERVADRYGAAFVLQPRHASGMNAAAALGSAALAAEGARIIAIIPGDLPQLDAREVDAAIRGAIASGGTIVVPDRHGQGTNGLVFAVEATPRFRYGAGSFRRHLERDAAAPTTPMLLRSFASDIDTPDDLHAFLDAGPFVRASRSWQALGQVMADGIGPELKKGGQTS